MDLFQVCSLIHRPQCNHSVINYLNKAIEKTNLRANFLYSCIVALPGILDTQDGGCFGVWIILQKSIPYKFEWDIKFRDLLNRWRQSRDEIGQLSTMFWFAITREVLFWEIYKIIMNLRTKIECIRSEWYFVNSRNNIIIKYDSV